MSQGWIPGPVYEWAKMVLDEGQSLTRLHADSAGCGWHLRISEAMDKLRMALEPPVPKLPPKEVTPHE